MEATQRVTDRDYPRSWISDRLVGFGVNVLTQEAFQYEFLTARMAARMFFKSRILDDKRFKATREKQKELNDIRDAFTRIGFDIQVIDSCDRLYPHDPVLVRHVMERLKVLYVRISRPNRIRKNQPEHATNIPKNIQQRLNG